MLTKRENLLETIRGGNPDRFVKQFEAFEIIYDDPYELKFPEPKYGGEPVKTGWGATKSWPIGTPGAFPIHKPELIACPDVAEWKKYVTAPPAKYSDEEWEPSIKHAASVDRKDKFVTAYIAPGVFEQCHYLLEIQNCLINFYEEPEAMHELIDYITDWEVEYAKEMCKHFHPDAIYHHDDWGSQISTFLSPEMFDEFYLPAYKRIYGTFRENGVELIVHHSDSFGATLIPSMIDMGIDIWQGIMRTNDIAKCVKEYGGKISFMGGVDSALVDHPGWTEEEVVKVVEETCRDYGSDKKFFIPCQSQGGPWSTFEGVYEKIDEQIDRMSGIIFK